MDVITCAWGSKKENVFTPVLSLKTEKYKKPITLPLNQNKAINEAYRVQRKKAKQKIFINHSSKDKIPVNLFCKYVLDLGLGINLKTDFYNTSLDGSNPISGKDFRDSISDNLKNSKLVLQFISPNYKASEVCLNEMGAAWVLIENVVPIVINKGGYDVGFINSTKQQVKLYDEQSILKFINDYKKLLTEDETHLSVITENIKEFIIHSEKYFEEILD